MSKASDWAKLQPKPFAQNDVWAGVDNAGRLQLWIPEMRNADGYIVIERNEAMVALAKWLLTTFGDE